MPPPAELHITAEDLDPTAHVWVLVDVAAAAFQLSIRRTRELATTEGWRTSRGTGRTRPTTQYLWTDIVTTHNRRNHP
jgi:hypothetical protein